MAIGSLCGRETQGEISVELRLLAPAPRQSPQLGQVTSNKGFLFRASPAFHLVFPLASLRKRLELFAVDESDRRIELGRSTGDPLEMISNSLLEPVRCTRVESA